MRSLKGEVNLDIPAEKAWKMYRDDLVISKINPEMLARAEYIKGDGSPGSLRLFTLGPALQNFVKQSVENIENVVTGRSVTYRVTGGELRDLYDPYRVTFTFVPVEGKENEKCIAEWQAQFEPLTPTTPLPEKAKDAALEFLKCSNEFKLNY